MAEELHTSRSVAGDDTRNPSWNHQVGVPGSDCDDLGHIIGGLEHRGSHVDIRVLVRGPYLVEDDDVTLLEVHRLQALEGLRLDDPRTVGTKPLGHRYALR